RWDEDRRDRWDRQKLCRVLVPSAVERTLACVPAIHIRLDGNAEGCDADSLQPALQRKTNSENLSTNRRVDRRRLVAAVSRHGPDWQRAATNLQRLELHPDAADCVSAAACSMAPDDLAIWSDDQRWSKLRLRTLCSQDRRRTKSDVGPRHLERCVGRRRADSSGVD